MKMDPFIEAEEVAGHSVKHCCELFEVSRAAYYERKKAVPSTRELSDAELTSKTAAIHTESKGTYGSPRVHRELVKRGVDCGRRRVRRLMACAGLEGRHKKRWRKTTVPDPAAERAKDLILRQYFPKGTDLARWDRDDLDAVALALNTRPRKTLDWRTPAEALDALLQSTGEAGVATTG